MTALRSIRTGVAVSAVPAAPDGNGLVLFSGSGNAETWTWNGTTWTQQTPTTSPPSRAGAGMVYDAQRKQTVLFSGEGACCPTDLTDTWSWSGPTRSWSLKAQTGPPTRFFHGMAYDVARQQSVVFGGTGKSGLLADTWVWNGTAWKLKS